MTASNQFSVACCSRPRLADLAKLAHVPTCPCIPSSRLPIVLPLSSSCSRWGAAVEGRCSLSGVVGPTFHSYARWTGGLQYQTDRWFDRHTSKVTTFEPSGNGWAPKAGKDGKPEVGFAKAKRPLRLDDWLEISLVGEAAGPGHLVRAASLGHSERRFVKCRKVRVTGGPERAFFGGARPRSLGRRPERGCLG